MPQAVLSDGTKLEIVKESPATNVEIGKISSIGEIGFGEAEEIDVTPLNTGDGYRKYIQGLKDLGTISISGFHDATDAGQTELRALVASGAEAKFQVTFPDESSIAFAGFVKKYNFAETSVNAALSFSVDIRCTGKPTYADHSA